MNQERRRVAIVFDNFGNPNQPFLTEWFLRISESKNLLVMGFTDKVDRRGAVGRVIVFKPSRLAKVWRYLRWCILRLFDRSLSSVPLRHFELESFNPDVIHILNAQQHALYRDTIERLKCGVVVSFRGYETSVRPFEDEQWLEYLRNMYSTVDKLHFVSDFLKREAIALGAPHEKCAVIRRSVDTRFFIPPKRIDKTISFVNLLAVGRLTWQKGYEILLSSVSQLRAKGHTLKLTIVGEGPDRFKLEEIVHSLRISEIVSFEGHLSRTQLREMFWSADIFVQASVSDALPNSILEASACGLPVVSTTAGGIPEAVRHNFSGLLVTPGSVEELTKAIEEFIKDAKLGVSMGMNGRSLMEKEFSAAAELGRWQEFYLAT